MVGLTLVVGCSSSHARTAPHTTADGSRTTASATPGQTRPPAADSVRMRHNRYGIYYRPKGLGRCYGPGSKGFLGAQIEAYIGHAIEEPIAIYFRQRTQVLPSAITPVRVVVIAPSGRSAWADTVLTLEGRGTTLTFPEDF